MPAVSSSAISFVDHNPITLELHITFHKTGTYTYFGVPRVLYEAFLQASSAGKFFNEFIRDRFSANR